MYVNINDKNSDREEKSNKNDLAIKRNSFNNNDGRHTMPEVEDGTGAQKDEERTQVKS